MRTELGDLPIGKYGWYAQKRHFVAWWDCQEQIRTWRICRLHVVGKYRFRVTNSQRIVIQIVWPTGLDALILGSKRTPHRQSAQVAYLSSVFKYECELKLFFLYELSVRDLPVWTVCLDSTKSRENLEYDKVRGW